MRMEAFISFLSQSAWFFHNVDICWHIHVMPLARCVGHANNDVQNDVPRSCTKPMHQIHAKSGTCPAGGQNSRRTVSRNSCLFDPPRCFSCHHCPSCDAAATLIFWSDSKVPPNTRGKRGADRLRSLESEDVNCTLKIEIIRLFNTRD